MPLKKFANIRNIAGLGILIVVFNVLIMPSLAGKNNGKTIELLDLQFAYTPERAFQLLDSYDGPTRKSYIKVELTLDIIYPVVYTLFLSFSLFLLFPREQKLALLPYAILASDIFENMGIVRMLLWYPDKSTALAIATSTFSTIKWILVLVCIALVFAGLTIHLIKKTRHKESW